MCSHRWRSVQSGLSESAHVSPELVEHALLVEADGMSCVSQTHCRPRPELDIDLTPAYLSPGNSEAGTRPVG